jgi:hypothetical protein
MVLARTVFVMSASVRAVSQSGPQTADVNPNNVKSKEQDVSRYSTACPVSLRVTARADERRQLPTRGSIRSFAVAKARAALVVSQVG